MTRRVFTVKRCMRKLQGSLIATLGYIDHDAYMAMYVPFLRRNGMNIGKPRFIGPRCYFDGTDYSLITISDDVVISAEVAFLTHDYAISRAAIASSYVLRKEFAIVGPVCVERNSFIGYRVSVLPNTTIGHDSIVGAAAVVKGTVEPYSVMIGNPARHVGDVREWFLRMIKEHPEFGDHIERR